MQILSHEQIGASEEEVPKVVNNARGLAEQDVVPGVCLRQYYQIGEHGATLTRQMEDVMMDLGLSSRYYGIRIGVCGGWTYSKDKYDRMGETGDERSSITMPSRFLPL
jgi:hypothetical protein